MAPAFRSGFVCAIGIISMPIAYADRQQPPPPTVTVAILHADASGRPSRPFNKGEILAPKESPVLELRVDHPSYVTAVLYAKEGASEILNRDATQLWLDASTPLRVSVPRRAPVGVSEPELTVYVYAGVQPISPLLATLLNIPCALLDKGRGDPIDEPKTGSPSAPPPSQPEPEKPTPSRSAGGGKDSDPPNRGGGGRPTQCSQTPGVTAPATLRAIFLRSE